MDEITQIHNISERKVDFLERLKRDFKAPEDDSDQGEGPADNLNVLELPRPNADSRARDLMIRRIDKAIRYIEAHHEGLPRTLNDLRNSLDDVCCSDSLH